MITVTVYELVYIVLQCVCVCVCKGDLENVSLHFEGIFETLPTKTTPGGRSATHFTCKGGSQKMYLCILHVGMVPLKSSLF